MPTQDSSAAPIVDGIQMPTGRQIYDALMSKIEPDLLMDMIPTLDGKYAKESEAEKKKRLVRYQKAYAAYDKAYAEWISTFNSLVHAYKKEAMKSAETQAREEEGNALASIESQFSSK